MLGNTLEICGLCRREICCTFFVLLIFFLRARNTQEHAGVSSTYHMSDQEVAGFQYPGICRNYKKHRLKRTGEKRLQELQMVLGMWVLNDTCVSKKKIFVCQWLSSTLDRAASRSQSPHQPVHLAPRICFY